MKTQTIVEVPLVNANEQEVVVRELGVKEGQKVEAEEFLCSLETTKAAVEVVAPVAGFIRRLSVEDGQRVKVGLPICVITETSDEAVEVATNVASDQEQSGQATRKAQQLADANGISISDLHLDRIAKESDVLAFLASRDMGAATSDAAAPNADLPASPSGRGILILGAGGHARVLIDLLREGYRDRVIVGTLDDDPAAERDLLGVPLLGTSRELARLRQEGVEEAVLGVGAVTNNSVRAKLYKMLRQHGFYVPTLIHPRAIVEPSARFGQGCQIFPGGIVSSNAHLSENVIVNSGAVVSHDCVLGAHSHVTPGAILAGGVTVGETSVIGMGATIYLNIRIGANVVIGNGVHVFRDVPDGSVMLGNAA